MADQLNRESWLTLAVHHLRPLFSTVRIDLPRADLIRVSCGWPSAGGAKRENPVCGECWPGEACIDGSRQLFISPRIEEPFKVLHVLLHELIHAAIDDPDVGHRGIFKKYATRLGLTGKMTSTEPGPELSEKLQAILAELPEYPHAPISPKWKEKKQGCRQIKAQCDNAVCNYIIRLSRLHAKKGLPPACICGATFALEDPSLIEENEEASAASGAHGVRARIEREGDNLRIWVTRRTEEPAA